MYMYILHNKADFSLEAGEKSNGIVVLASKT